MYSKDNGKPTSGVLIDSSMILYRDFKKLMWLTALVLRAMKNLKTRMHGEEPSSSLSTVEYAYTEIVWICKTVHNQVTD